jgi:hypothetical protein
MPTRDNYKKIFGYLEGAFKPVAPVQLSKRELVDRLPEWLTTNEGIRKYVESSLVVVFKLNKNYTVEKYVDDYDQFRKGCLDYTHELRDEINQVQGLIRNMFKDYTEQFKEAMKSGKENPIYHHNFTVLSNFYEFLVGRTACYINYATRRIIQSHDAYKSIIQMMYDRVLRETETIKKTSISEEKLPTKERNQLEDTEFGIPSLRKYPLNDRAHVLAAIRLSGHCPKEHEAELARNIFRAMKKYGIPMSVIGKDNMLYKYIPSNQKEEDRS